MQTWQTAAIWLPMVAHQLNIMGMQKNNSIMKSKIPATEVHSYLLNTAIYQAIFTFYCCQDNTFLSLINMQQSAGRQTYPIVIEAIYVPTCMVSTGYYLLTLSATDHSIPIQYERNTVKKINPNIYISLTEDLNTLVIWTSSQTVRKIFIISTWENTSFYKIGLK